MGKDVSSNYGIFNPGTLNPHQLAQLLAVLSDDSVDNTTLDSLQKKLSRSFIAGDSMKVRKILIFDRGPSISRSYEHESSNLCMFYVIIFLNFAGTYKEFET